jgi:putative phage-type endonuclease
VSDTDLEAAARTEWLGWRKLGIGASDVAALCGMSPYASPMSVYMDKLGLVPPDEDNEYMEYGRRAEPMLTDYFEDRTGLFVTGQQDRVEHPDFPHHRATLDGRVHDHPDGDPLGVVEYKTAERGTEKQWSEKIPEHYAIQLQWQLHVDQQERGWFGVMHGRLFRHYPVERDQRTIDLLIQMVDVFWAKHVLAEVPPPADAHKATAAALSAAYPDPVEGAEASLDGLEQVLAERDQAAADMADAKVRKSKADSTIKARLGDAEIGTIKGEPIATWKKQTRAATAASEFRVLRVTTKGRS